MVLHWAPSWRGRSSVEQPSAIRSFAAKPPCRAPATLRNRRRFLTTAVFVRVLIAGRCECEGVSQGVQQRMRSKTTARVTPSFGHSANPSAAAAKRRRRHHPGSSLDVFHPERSIRPVPYVRWSPSNSDSLSSSPSPLLFSHFSNIFCCCVSPFSR